MRKNIINCFVVALFTLTLLTGCRTKLEYTNVSDQSPYSDLIGKHYIVLKNFYLVRLSGCSGYALRFCGQNGVPKEFNKSKIGEKFKNGEIVGIVPKNTEFTLIKIVKYDLVDHIHVVILIPTISFSSRFNDVEASVLRNENTATYDFKFYSDLVKEVQSVGE